MEYIGTLNPNGGLPKTDNCQFTDRYTFCWCITTNKKQKFFLQNNRAHIIIKLCNIKYDKKFIY